MPSSYDTIFGIGDRTSVITVTTSPAPSAGTANNLVDGVIADNNTDAMWFASGATAREIVFDFGSGISVIVTEVTWYSATSVAQGTWKWQGSNDNSTWVDIGGTFSLAGNVQIHTSLNANSTAYRYLKIIKTTGSTTTMRHLEVEFKAEVLSPEANDVRATQFAIQVLTASQTPVRVTQVPILLVSTPPQPTRVTQVPIQIMFPLDAEPVLPMLPQWPVRETLSWLTSITTSRFGYEQRMGVRVDPDMVLDLVVPLSSQRERQQAFQTLYRYIGQAIEYPLYQYGTPLLAGATIGESFLQADVTLGNFRTGEAVRVYSRDGSVWVRGVVDTVSDSPMGVQLLEPLEQSVEEDWLIAPAPVFRVPDQSQMGLDAGDNGSMTLSLRMVPPRSVLRPDQSTSALLQTYSSLYILPDLWVAADVVPETFMRDVDTLEAVSNRMDIRNWLHTQRATLRRFAVEKEDLDYWRAWLSAASGRRVPFLMPSLMHDFDLVAPPTLGSSTLVTGQTELSDYLASKANRWLRLERVNGSVIYRQISSYRLEMDRTVTMQLDASVGANPGDNQFQKISITSLSRLGSDEVTLEHYVNHVEISFTVQTVEQ